MFHSDALKLLMPIKLDGVFTDDLATEGDQLDLAAASAETLLAELFPDQTYFTLDSWERVYGITPGIDDPLQLRQNRVVQKMRDLGRLDRTYFIQMAAALGYTVTIQELGPFMAGWHGAGDEVMADDADYCWRVWYSEADGGYYFRAGESAAGENLSYSYFTVMQALFEELKPAHTFVEFIEV